MKAMAHKEGGRNFTYMNEIISKMLLAELEASPLAWEAELFLHVILLKFSPNEKDGNCRHSMKEPVEEPALHWLVDDPYGYNPLAYAIDENDSDRANFLREKER